MKFIRSKIKKYIKRNIQIYYGSQTGTSSMFATELSEMLNTNPIDLIEFKKNKDFEKKFFNQEVKVFFLSCYGQGEPTDNAKDFYNWLIKQEKEEKFRNLR
jgi:NADPH-ferrihemoprotein reductase